MTQQHQNPRQLGITSIGITVGVFLTVAATAAGLWMATDDSLSSEFSASAIQLSAISSAAPESAAAGTVAQDYLLNSIISYISPLLWISGTLFFIMYVLYIFAKLEGQDEEGFQKNARSYADSHFPSLVFMETSAMLYMITIILAALIFIAKFQVIFGVARIDQLDNHFVLTALCVVFAVLGGTLAQLYYFLNKVQPEKVSEDEAPRRRHVTLEFDINRVPRYLAFPFLSAGMGMLAYILTKGVLMEFATPPFWALMFLAIVAGFFSDLFVIMVKEAASKLRERFAKSGPSFQGLFVDVARK